MICRYCGINVLTTGDIDGKCFSCRNKQTLVGYQSAWICPKCGSVYGPSQTECIRCNPPIIPVVTC
jgi:hypothetical protein